MKGSFQLEGVKPKQIKKKREDRKAGRKETGYRGIRERT